MTVPSRDGMDEWMAKHGDDLVSGRDASEILGVKHGTLHVWTHRGKIAVDSYARDPFGQQCAMYRLSDVLDLHYKTQKRGA